MINRFRFRQLINKELMKIGLSYLVSYLGIFMVTVYLVTEYIEEGSIGGLIHHLLDDIKFFYHVTVFLTIPAFAIIGYYYRKQLKLTTNLEKMVDERTNELKSAQKIIVETERFAVIGEAATVMAHDLRNPLQSISNATYFLEKKLGEKMSANEEKMIKLIQGDIKYAENILEDLLNYSKELVIDPTEYSLIDVINNIFSLIKLPENVYVEKTIPSDTKIFVDLQQFSRAIINFIQNSLDAMSQGGKISFAVKEFDRTIELTITDTGEGIPKEIQEKVGTPFYTTKAKGIGLGLSISRRIIEAHSGGLSVKSNLGTGTSIIITLTKKPKIIRKQVLTINNRL